MFKVLLKAKLLISVIIAGAILLGAYLLVKNPFEWHLKIFEKKLEIENTANVISQIKKISEFTSACYYKEFVVKKQKEEDTALGSVLRKIHLGDYKHKYELSLIAKGSVRAGLNLSKVADDGIEFRSDTVLITLPKAEIFDVIINPSDYDVYVEEGHWTHDEIVKVKKQTEVWLKEAAIADGLLEKANKLGVEKLKGMFKTFGFKEVLVSQPD